MSTYHEHYGRKEGCTHLPTHSPRYPATLQKHSDSLCISQLDIQRDDAMTSSTVFTSNRSQAVRLPKAVAFPADVHHVDILKIGRSRLIVPQGRRWDDL